MALIAKIVIVVGIILIDAGIFIILLRAIFKKGFAYKISGIIIAVAAVLFSVGVYLNQGNFKAAHKQPTVVAQTYGKIQTKQIIKDIKILFHKSPAEVEKTLGKPDGPITSGSSKQLLKSGPTVAATVCTYMKGMVRVTFFDDKAGHVSIVPKSTFKYPNDTQILFATYGIPLIKAPARVTPYAVDWENTMPGIYRVQFSTVNNRITNIGIVFLGAEDTV